MFRQLLPIALYATSVFAQTFTDCNPLDKTCPDEPALGTTLSQTFNKSMAEFTPQLWNVTAGESLITFTEEGAELVLTSERETVTVQSTFYIFWGVTEVIFKAAHGTGIISTAILLSNDLDEIDWEIKGGNTTTVSNNYYGWGNLSQLNAEYPALDNPQDKFHNYTIDWTQERILFYLDGNVVRTVPYQEVGKYPQTPSRVQFGVWCGGCSKSEGTVAWAGGKPDWSEGPFTMTVKSLRISDGTTNSSLYSYGDRSGTWESIQIQEGESAAYKAMNKLSTTQKVQKHWEGLSNGAKIGIACGVLGGVGIAAIVFAFYCIKQRRAGKAEAALQEKEWERQNAELMEYRSMMANGNFAVSRQSIMMDMKPMGGKKF